MSLIRTAAASDHPARFRPLIPALPAADEPAHAIFGRGGSDLISSGLERLLPRRAKVVYKILKFFGLGLDDIFPELQNDLIVALAGATRDRYAPDLDARGVLRDRSRAVFNGKVIVHPGADGTDAAQSNRNLLLSQNAEIDTKPQLEIYADDVKCTHGATVGRLDEEAVFYLRSRGIDRVVRGCPQGRRDPPDRRRHRPDDRTRRPSRRRTRRHCRCAPSDPPTPDNWPCP